LVAAARSARRGSLTDMSKPGLWNCDRRRAGPVSAAAWRSAHLMWRLQIHTDFLLAAPQHSLSRRGQLHGPVVYRTHCGAGTTHFLRRGVVPAADGTSMSALYWTALLLTLGLFGYLLYAMLNAERF
jgi:K+-transporting ATPase KdpF subunit